MTPRSRFWDAKRQTPLSASRMRMMVGTFVLGLSVILAGCSPTSPDGPGSVAPSKTTSSSSPSSSGATLDEVGVAAGHPLAAKIGVGILNRGGNAADAAIATAFAVSVLEPHASGIGGGGVSLISRPGQEPAAFDYREVVAKNGIIPESGTGVPGFVDGLWTIHQKYGSLPWDALLQPAEKIARDGFEIPQFLGERMNSGIGSQVVSKYPQFRARNGARVLREGEKLVQTELARTIESLAANGRDEFYEGSLAKKLAKIDGLDAQTLADYETERFTPVQGQVGDYTVLTAPPALPGAGLIQMLQQAEGAGIAHDAPGSAAYVEKMMKAWSNANETVTQEFGDQRFADVNLSSTLDRARNLKIGAEFPVQGSSQPPEGEIDPGNTTHLVVIDRQGMAVSMTNTITSFWGGTKSDVVGGFFLNNQLSRFNTVDSPQNQPEPGRKSVTWSNPTMIRDAQGRVVMGIGTPGGQQIPNILASVLVPVLLQNQPLQDAIDGPRFHLQGGTLAVEGKASAGLKALAKEQQWSIRETTRADGIFGSVQSLRMNPEDRTIEGATDHRRDGGHVVSPASE